MATTAPRTAADEWRSQWTLPLAGMAGLTFGTIPSATLGLFMDPLSGEFGWSRSQIALGMTVFAVVSTPLTPFAGALVDRFGARRVGLPGLVLSGLVFAAFAAMTGAIWQWLGIWVLYSIASLAIRTLVWNSAISNAFTAGRGMAIAVVLCGTALTSALSPLLARWLADSYGWRMAYLGLGLGWGGIAALVVAAFFHDSRSRKAVAASKLDASPRPQPTGLSFGEAMRDPRILRISVAILLQSIMGGALLVNLVPLLNSTGISRAEAAGMAALLGIGSLCGKLGSGFLLDRFASGVLPFMAFALPAAGCLLLLQAGGSIAISSLAIVLIGLAGGASLQVTTYLTSRYAGVLHFGKIFGIMSSLMGLAGGIGPLLGATIFDTTGNYTLLLAIAVPAALIAGLLVWNLGPYPHYPDASPDTGGGKPMPAAP